MTKLDKFLHLFVLGEGKNYDLFYKIIKKKYVKVYCKKMKNRQKYKNYKKIRDFSSFHKFDMK